MYVSSDRESEYREIEKVFVEGKRDKERVCVEREREIESVCVEREGDR